MTKIICYSTEATSYCCFLIPTLCRSSDFIEDQNTDARDELKEEKCTDINLFHVRVREHLNNDNSSVNKHTPDVPKDAWCGKSSRELRPFSSFDGYFVSSQIVPSSIRSDCSIIVTSFKRIVTIFRLKIVRNKRLRRWTDDRKHWLSSPQKCSEMAKTRKPQETFDNCSSFQETHFR